MHLPELNALFVHIPKVAGNSIKQVLGIGWEEFENRRLRGFAQIFGLASPQIF